MYMRTIVRTWYKTVFLKIAGRSIMEHPAKLKKHILYQVRIKGFCIE
ncbi:hypothetical protein [Thalassobacillus sp. CUG 92003]|nr:hypothetical protein [Thalassobacillus sp. CUG 92003]